MSQPQGVPSDPFALLGLPPEFDVDPARVERAWLRLAGELHPDRTHEDDESQGRLAQINESRQILLDPEQRANALLMRLGGSAMESDRSLPEGFLAEMMEVREQAEEARASGDTSRWEEFRAWADARRQRHIESVRELFAGSPDERALRSIRVELNAWRYIERMLEQLDDSRGVM